MFKMKLQKRQVQMDKQNIRIKLSISEKYFQVFEEMNFETFSIDNIHKKVRYRVSRHNFFGKSSNFKIKSDI